MKKFSDLKIAIIHDNIRYFGGSERVIIVLHTIWPKAPIYTSSVYWEGLGKFKGMIKTLHPITSWAQRIPYFPKFPYLYRYLLPLVWQSFDFSGFDIVISSSGAQMSHLINNGNTMHICYCHTPPRHLYGFMTDLDLRKYRFFQPVIDILNSYLKIINIRAVKGVDFFIANSDEVQKRIKKFYHRESTVINPPVSTVRQRKLKTKNGSYFLSVSRLSRMKHNNIIINACKKLNLPLKIVGAGPEQGKLEMLKDKNIRFLGQVAERELFKLYANCKTVICAAEDEDFGIVPVEAMSFGKPVIAYFSGGYKETVIEEKTGTFFHNLTVSSLIRAIQKLSDCHILESDCHQRAEKFNRERFRIQIKKFVEEKYDEYLISKS